MKKWLWRIGILLLVLIIAGLWLVRQRLYDRHPGYEVDLRLGATAPAVLQAGFARATITPRVPDSWTDKNGDARYRRRDGDRYEDRNGNGHFDPIWLAGFQNRRPAQGIHDPLWARVMVLDDGATRLALVALDAIGFMSDDIIDIRKRLPAEWEVDYTIITSTHTHEAPDLLGLWGEGHFTSGVDPAYLEFVKLQTVQAIGVAVAALRPARLQFAQDLNGADSLVEDSRPPQVLDSGIRLMRAVDAEADTTLGVLFSWANHPETLWSDNLLITSDFPHYVREGLERGVYRNDSLLAPGLGGTAVYVNGAIGGLMTTSPGFGIPDPFQDTVYMAPSFDKARAQGDRLAMLGLAALRDSGRVELEQGALQVRAKSVNLPLYNRLYRLAAILGVIDRGTPRWMQIRSEVACWRIGPATFLHYPGEMYPEILNGGIQAPEGRDFQALDAVEVPALRSFLPGTFQFTVGLSNDMIGYIIPKSQWDEKPPFTFQFTEAPYGEINSVGPETAPLLYQALKEVIKDIKGSNAPNEK